MAIFLNSTLTLTNSTSFSHHPNPKKHHNHKLSYVTCRATAGATASATVTTATDLYKILSLKPQESDPEEIKKAYRIMALKYHPDVCNTQNSSSMSKEESTRKFLQVHAAYKTLSDPVLREEYENGLQSRGFRGSTMADFDAKKRWRDQLDELRRRSVHRTAHKGNSWAGRIRSQNTNN